MLAIQLVLWLGGSGPVGDGDLWYHHREILFFSEAAERKLQRSEGLKSSWVNLGASKEDLRVSMEGLRASCEGLGSSREGLEATWESL